MIKFTCLVLPWEVTQFSSLVNNLLISGNHLDKNDIKNIKFKITYSNIENQINWSESKMTKECTEVIFANACKLLKKFFEVDYEVNNDIKGVVGHRRVEFEKYDYDYCCTFDSDIQFDYRLLKKIHDSCKLISSTDKNPHIITPSLPCYWDESWDIISMMSSKQYDYWKKNLSLFSIPLYHKNDVQLVKLPTFKFGGGFFTCYSKSFLEQYKLPIELGDTYGLEDTYILLKALYEKFSKNKPLTQYLLRGLLVFDKRDCGELSQIRELFTVRDLGKSILTLDDINKLVMI
jgi:hypothetical protein